MGRGTSKAGGGTDGNRFQLIRGSADRVSNPRKEVSGGWDYQGVKDQTNKLIEAESRSQSPRRRAEIARAASKQLTTIETLMKENDGGDKRSLMTQRRRLRQLLKKMEY